METQTTKLLALCQTHARKRRARRDQGRRFCNAIPAAKLMLTSVGAATVIRWNRDAPARVPIKRATIAA
eukprot:1574072-Pyramimonas_sp.AAC.1